jgi:uncharacterized membrane protein
MPSELLFGEHQMDRRTAGLKLLGNICLFAMMVSTTADAGTYTTTVNIRVKDRNNRSVPSATVKIGKAEFRSDSNGQVILRNVRAGSYYVTAYRYGFGSGSSRFTAAPGQGIPNVTIKLR